MNKAIVKFNNGNLALLCGKCNTIIKNGSEFSHDEMKKYNDNLWESQLCETCSFDYSNCVISHIRLNKNKDMIMACIYDDNNVLRLSADIDYCVKCIKDSLL